MNTLRTTERTPSSLREKFNRAAGVVLVGAVLALPGCSDDSDDSERVGDPENVIAEVDNELCADSARSIGGYEGLQGHAFYGIETAGLTHEQIIEEFFKANNDNAFGHSARAALAFIETSQAAVEDLTKETLTNLQVSYSDVADGFNRICSANVTDALDRGEAGAALGQQNVVEVMPLLSETKDLIGVAYSEIIDATDLTGLIIIRPEDGVSGAATLYAIDPVTGQLFIVVGEGGSNDTDGEEEEPQTTPNSTTTLGSTAPNNAGIPTPGTVELTDPNPTGGPTGANPTEPTEGVEPGPGDACGDNPEPGCDSETPDDNDGSGGPEEPVPTTSVAPTTTGGTTTTTTTTTRPTTTTTRPTTTTTRPTTTTTRPTTTTEKPAERCDNVPLTIAEAEAMGWTVTVLPSGLVICKEPES